MKVAPVPPPEGGVVEHRGVRTPGREPGRVEGAACAGAGDWGELRVPCCLCRDGGRGTAHRENHVGGSRILKPPS